MLFILYLNGLYSVKVLAYELAQQPASRINQSYPGNSGIPIWSNLTEFEMEAVSHLAKAKSGDADSLLMLYLIASGDSRTFAQYNRHLLTINQFVKSISVQMNNESSEWRKGFILLQAMHEQFFLGGKENSENGYSFEQSQLSHIFESRRFNCISSSLLYTVLARKFELEVKGVLLPSHAFVQLKLADGKIIDIETTSTRGYGWEHNRTFYNKMDTQWFQKRGLTPSTFEDYQNRQIVSPVMLGVDNMTHQHTSKDRMSEKAHSRMVEILSTIDSSNIKAHKLRLKFYNNEFVRLNKGNNYVELDKMYFKTRDFLTSLESYRKMDSELDNMMGWVGSQIAYVATKKGENEKALRIAHKTMQGLNDSIKDKDKIIANIFTSLNLVSQTYTNQQAFEKALNVYQGVHAQCVANGQCGGAVGYLYSKWASSFWDKKQWPAAIDKYQQYLALTSNGKAAASIKENMQSAFINWANQYYKTGDWLEVNRILSRCIKSNGKTELCQNHLSDLKKSHRLD